MFEVQFEHYGIIAFIYSTVYSFRWNVILSLSTPLGFSPLLVQLAVVDILSASAVAMLDRALLIGITAKSELELAGDREFSSSKDAARRLGFSGVGAVRRHVRFSDKNEYFGNCPDSKVYSRLLLSEGAGYPLYHPQPCDDLPEPARRDGTAIGDVGVVTWDGSFDPIFNITHSTEDPANRFGVPHGFSQLKLAPEDVQTKPMSYAPGSIIANDVTDAASESGTGPCEAEVKTNSKAAAMLMLPDGASSWDLRPQSLFRDYALKHAKDWYNFVNGVLKRMIGTGDLYLVTGVTKSTSWAIAATQDFSGDEKVSLDFGASQGVAETKHWESSSVFDAGPNRSPGEEMWKDNQTVFIRGFKVAVRPPLSANDEDSDDEEWPEDGGLSNLYHPSDDINQHILESNPTASVAVTHDDEWACVFKDTSPAACARSSDVSVIVSGGLNESFACATGDVNPASYDCGGSTLAKNMEIISSLNSNDLASLHSAPPETPTNLVLGDSAPESAEPSRATSTVAAPTSCN